MSRGLNKVTLLGNLGQKPEIRHTPSGVSVCNMSLATTEYRKNSETGERTEKTEWHRVVLFGRLAEIAEEYLNKGSQACVEGRLQTNRWQDQEGRERFTTEIIASDLILIGGRQSSFTDKKRGSGESQESVGDSVSSADLPNDEIPF